MHTHYCITCVEVNPHIDEETYKSNDPEGMQANVHGGMALIELGSQNKEKYRWNDQCGTEYQVYSAIIMRHVRVNPDKNTADQRLNATHQREDNNNDDTS